MKKTAVSLLSLLLAFGASAQQTTLNRADIPHLPTDTLPTHRDDVRTVIFSDGTFRFIPTEAALSRCLEACTAGWDTVSVFAYRNVELRDLPETIPLTIADSAGVRFRSPVTGEVISKYGKRGRRSHNGTDIRLTHGQPVFAAFDGIVRYSRWNGGGFGNIIIIRHPGGLETYYSHLSRRAARAGEWVAAGQVVGYGGRTGRASTEHLHFEVRYADQSFDPERLIDFRTGSLRCSEFALKREYINIDSRAVEGIDGGGEVLAGADSTASFDRAASNPLAGADSLATGAAAGQTAAPGPVYHTVKSGDTLLAIARRYGTTTAEICRRNGITRNGILKIGKKLRIK